MTQTKISDEERDGNVGTETETARTISVPARELRARLKAVMPHVGTDDTLPALTCIWFGVSGGSLYVAATDRYTMAVARLRIAGTQSAPLPDRSALLPMPSVRSLRRLLKGADIVALAIGGGELTADASQGESCTWKTQAGDFPKWRSTLHKMLSYEPAELGNDHGVAPGKLARFAVGGRKGGDWPGLDPLHIRATAATATGQNLPVLLVTRGDWFLGCLMPVRRPDPETMASAWADWASVTAAVPAAAEVLEAAQ